jgi:GDP-mannose 4,6 dehydratase
VRCSGLGGNPAAMSSGPGVRREWTDMAREHGAGRFSRKRVVVTGGAGFLGSHLCDALLAEGAHVLCLDNFLTSTAANIAHMTGRQDFQLMRCDVMDFTDIPGRVDAILHLASPASPADYLRLPIHTLKVGAFGTWHALELAKAKRRGSCWPPRRRSTATRRSIPSRRSTGATSTRSGRAVCTTRPTATPRR